MFTWAIKLAWCWLNCRDPILNGFAFSTASLLEFLQSRLIAPRLYWSWYDEISTSTLYSTCALYWSKKTIVTFHKKINIKFVKLLLIWMLEDDWGIIAGFPLSKKCEDFQLGHSIDRLITIFPFSVIRSHHYSIGFFLCPNFLCALLAQLKNRIFKFCNENLQGWN